MQRGPRPLQPDFSEATSSSSDQIASAIAVGELFPLLFRSQLISSQGIVLPPYLARLTGRFGSY